jgi:osmoprotectant transport system ATP-binding protein
MTVPASGQRAATVEFDHVTKSYDARATKPGAPGAVNDLSLTVPAGKICVLVGPSGCGKTTSLKMVNRLIEPTSGRILLDGVDAATRDVTELRRSIGYVIQQTGLFPHQTIEENVATVPRLLGWPKDRLHARAQELLAVVGLEPGRYAGRYPAQLSGGERQRVGVARALAADPPVMLMDEPFGAVDPIVRERLQNEFLRLQEQLAKTILFVTHDIDEAIKMGDLVAVFRAGGVVEQFGTPAEILAAPASDFVARFVGADRGLKRLSLTRVDHLELATAATARVGADAGEARRRALASPFPYLLLLDESDRPVGWVSQQQVPASGRLGVEQASTTSPLFDRRTTLKDALSMLLDDDVQAGVVVDRRGVFRGLVTAQQVMAFMRETARESLERIEASPGEPPPVRSMRERALEVAAVEAAEENDGLGVTAGVAAGPGDSGEGARRSGVSGGPGR